MTPVLQRRLGKAIRRLRTARGYSQESFADHVGVHRTYMGALERGEQNVSLAILDRVAKGLGLKPWELLRDADHESG
jgi:transcriptional regulator with XRE-family HTH domain